MWTKCNGFESFYSMGVSFGGDRVGASRRMRTTPEVLWRGE